MKNKRLHQTFRDNGNVWWEVYVNEKDRMHGLHTYYRHDGLIDDKWHYVDSVREGERINYCYD